MLTATHVSTPLHKYPMELPLGQVMPFQCITEPGAYVCNWSGHLLRISYEALTTARNPVIEIVGAGGLFVTRISENPYIPAAQARLLAANYNLAANF